MIHEPVHRETGKTATAQDLPGAARNIYCWQQQEFERLLRDTLGADGSTGVESGARSPSPPSSLDGDAVCLECSDDAEDTASLGASAFAPLPRPLPPFASVALSQSLDGPNHIRSCFPAARRRCRSRSSRRQRSARAWAMLPTGPPARTARTREQRPSPRTRPSSCWGVLGQYLSSCARSLVGARFLKTCRESWGRALGAGCVSIWHMIV